MSVEPFQVTHELPGWELVWIQVAVLPGSAGPPADLRAACEARARDLFASEGIASHPTASAVRSLFRAAGTDPTRYRPSSEALLRRVLKGEALPALHPLVDLNNCLSMELVVPCCIVAEETLRPPLTLRAGREGESFLSLRGPIGLEGKPLLEDAEGPFGTPITDSVRGKIHPETERAWMVAYLPAGEVTAREAKSVLQRLLATAPVATTSAFFVTS